MAHPHLFGALHCGQIERPLPPQPCQGPDRPLHRLRSADADGLRQRPRAGSRRGGQGGCTGLPPGRHAHAARGHPARGDEYVDDHQRHGGVAARPLRGGGRRAGCRARQAHRHDPERHHQGIPLARHLRVPARAVAALDQGHRRLQLPHAAQVEPRQRVLLSSAGGGARRRCRRWRSRSPPHRRSWIPCAIPARCRRRRSAPWSAASRSSSTPACASSPRCARCVRSRSCGTRSRPSAMALPIRATGASATACRSTRSGSPSRRPRTMSTASC